MVPIPHDQGSHDLDPGLQENRWIHFVYLFGKMCITWESCRLQIYSWCHTKRRTRGVRKPPWGIPVCDIIQPDHNILSYSNRIDGKRDNLGWLKIFLRSSRENESRKKFMDLWELKWWANKKWQKEPGAKKIFVKGARIIGPFPLHVDYYVQTLSPGMVYNSGMRRMTMYRPYHPGRCITQAWGVWLYAPLKQGV